MMAMPDSGFRIPGFALDAHGLFSIEHQALSIKYWE